MKFRTLVSVAVCFFAVFSVHSQTVPVRPKRNDAVLVIKVRIQPAINEDFFRGYVKESKRYPLVTKAYIDVASPSGFLYLGSREIGPLNHFGYPTVGIPKERVLRFNGFSVWILNQPSFYLNFPIGLEFTVPEDTPYLYMGTFVYRYSDEYFTMASFEREDEFDEALAELRAALGPDVKLSRAVFREAAP